MSRCPHSIGGTREGKARMVFWQSTCPAQGLWTSLLSSHATPLSLLFYHFQLILRCSAASLGSANAKQPLFLPLIISFSIHTTLQRCRPGVRQRQAATAGGAEASACQSTRGPGCTCSGAAHRDCAGAVGEGPGGEGGAVLTVGCCCCSVAH